MTFAINSERESTLLSIKLIEKIRHQAPHHIRQAKDFSNIKLIFKLLEKHLNELQNMVIPQSEVKLTLFLEANTRIMNHISKKFQ